MKFSSVKCIRCKGTTFDVVLEAHLLRDDDEINITNIELG